MDSSLPSYHYVDPLAPVAPRSRYSSCQKWSIAAAIVVAFVMTSVIIDNIRTGGLDFQNMMDGDSTTTTTTTTSAGSAPQGSLLPTPPGPNTNQSVLATPMARPVPLNNNINNNGSNLVTVNDVDSVMDRWDSWKHLIVYAWEEMSGSLSSSSPPPPPHGRALESVARRASAYQTNVNVPGFNGNISVSDVKGNVSVSVQGQFSVPKFNISSHPFNLTGISQHISKEAKNLTSWWMNYYHKATLFGTPLNRTAAVSKPHFPPLLFMNHSDAFDALIDASNDDSWGRDYTRDYFMVNQGLDAQINQAYCAVSTTAAILNSFKGRVPLPMAKVYKPYHYATQKDLLNACTNERVVTVNSTFNGILSPPGGLVLDQMKALLECHLDKADRVHVYHADPAKVTFQKMKSDMLAALVDPNKRVLINFDRAAVGQAGGGHFSPIGAYSHARDAFLVMDVSKYKYPESWIPAELLYDSLSTFDPCGSWNYPTAQEQLPAHASFVETRAKYIQAMKLVGCKPAYRGYIVVTVA